VQYYIVKTNEVPSSVLINNDIYELTGYLCYPLDTLD